MDFDAFLDTATAVAQESAATPVAPTEKVESVETPQVTEISTPEAPKPDSELTPEQLAKREANRKSHENSREARMRRELRAVKAELAKITQPQPQPQEKPNLPKAEAFENLDDWVLATAQALADVRAKENQPTPLDAEAVKRNNRIQELANKEYEFASKAPDYERLVYLDHADLMGAMPEHIATALLEADDASLALYTLAKEGRLYDLEEMSPQRVAIEIGKAEERGKAYMQPAKTISSAPAPMKAARGNSTINKPMTGKEALALLKT